MNIETILTNYVACALWSSTDDNGDPLDANYTIDDIAPTTLTSMREDVANFINANKRMLIAGGLDDGQIGHDFWLTRNRHGAGFWDRGLGEVGNRLTHASHACGEVYLYVGDDLKLHS